MKKESRKIALCKGDDHEWVDVYRWQRDVHTEVVKWCRNCGCIKVDREQRNFNGYGFGSKKIISSGEIRPIERPRITQSIINESTNITDELSSEEGSLDIEFMA